MEEQEMVDRVAKAMAAKEGWRWEDDSQMLDRAASGLQNTSRERDSWRNRARAAIEAMPDQLGAVREELRLRMLKHPTSGNRDTYSDGFQQGLAASIDALDALSSSTRGEWTLD